VRLSPAVLCVALLAACGGGAEPEQGGVLGARYTEPRWATPAEVRWLGKVARWSAGFARIGVEVSRFETAPEFDRVLRGEPRAVGRYRRVLAPIRSCASTFGGSVGRAPTPRLRDSERRFRESCARFRDGVDLMLRAVGERDPGLADDARAAIEEAAKQSAIAAGALPPGEKQHLPRRGGMARVSRVEPRFSRAASRVAEKDAAVRCWSERDWRRLMTEEHAYTRGKVNPSVLGFASAGGSRLSLAPSTCRGLAQLAYEGDRPVARSRRLMLALAVVTLAHESVHLAGVADEPTAECHGIQLSERAALALGVEPALAEELKDAYWEHYGEIPTVYRSRECRDGGKLDLRASTSEFP
jgi:hypothetical protein